MICNSTAFDQAFSSFYRSSHLIPDSMKNFRVESLITLPNAIRYLRGTIGGDFAPSVLFFFSGVCRNPISSW